jgi:hypothetical protein
MSSKLALDVQHVNMSLQLDAAPYRQLWGRGVTRIEIYNEPDLDNDFQLADGSFNHALWVDTITLRSRAIQDTKHCFADLNAESSVNLVPDIQVGAYAKTTYGGGNLGQPGVQARRKTFATSPDHTWQNFQTYSYHSYGERAHYLHT